MTKEEYRENFYNKWLYFISEEPYTESDIPPTFPPTRATANLNTWKSIINYVKNLNNEFIMYNQKISPNVGQITVTVIHIKTQKLY